jgi:hypothetical protein
MTKLVVKFGDFANAPKKENKPNELTELKHR